jgi:hypothetical protein
VCIYIYIYIITHTHTYICVCVCVCNLYVLEIISILYCIKIWQKFDATAVFQSLPPLLSIFPFWYVFFRYHCRSNVPQVHKCMHIPKLICLKIFQTPQKNKMDIRRLFISPLHRFCMVQQPPMGQEILLVLIFVTCWVDRNDYVNEKFKWHRRESNPRPSGV